jgi:hypothetical protein
MQDGTTYHQPWPQHGVHKLSSRQGQHFAFADSKPSQRAMNTKVRQQVNTMVEEWCTALTSG